MKIIFLDFDGVLNSEKYIRACRKCGVIVNPSSMLLLKQIVDRTGAYIVLSTSWREHWGKNEAECDDVGLEINRIFDDFGLKIFDKTPKMNYCREDEIEEWLIFNPEVENFVVLDDAFLDSKKIRNHFVKTDNYKDGLDENDVEKAITILK